MSHPTRPPSPSGNTRPVASQQNSKNHEVFIETLDGDQIHVRFTVGDEHVLVSGPNDSVLIPVVSLLKTIDENGSAGDHVITGAEAAKSE